MRTLILFLIALAVSSCSCSSSSGSNRLRIGVDPSWSPLNFDELQPFVNGYTEDFLLEVARDSGLEFEKVVANWDTLLDGMRSGEYDAVLTSLHPYAFNQAKFDFSKDYLLLGPVLVTTPSAGYTSLKQLSGELVGLVSGDPAILIVEKYPDVIVRTYNSIPETLDALLNGEIEAAILDRLPTVNYAADLYAGQFKIASPPLTESGLHLIAPKGKSGTLVRAFDKSISQMEKKKKLSELQKKWNLAS